MTWEEKALAAFVQHYKPGLGRNEYLDALCASMSAYQDLVRLSIALAKLFTAPGIKLSLDVSNAIALSALVLYERHHVENLDKVADISAANLLMAAVQASARQGTDAVVKGDDPVNGAPSNSALLPGGFTAYRKDSEEYPEWEEVKRSLNFSAEVLLKSIGDLSYRTMREKFKLHAPDMAKRHGAISDNELKIKLHEAEAVLGGRFVFFVSHGDTDNLAYKHRQNIQSEFGVQTVIWKREREASDAAAQIDAIFEQLFETTQGKEVGDTPPSLPSPPSATPQSRPDTADSAWDKLNDRLKSANETAEQGNKLLDAGAKAFEKAAPLAALWHAFKAIIS